ncbi:MAG: MarR family transcriptional regulator [Actinomycetia bacterium]|nr:MarR family transcriptional regulator [Actinomycetes bacterium]MCP4223238.1 MarR family transcriptional regulator [Actinomycetes bacterium]MCP5033690.1 MarR family transcriptional regulator [Actinomycetes bacterium]
MRLLERLDHELQQRSQLSLTDFEILSVLASAPDQRLRMSDLAERVLVSRSRLTYRVDRLVRVNYLAREECEDDRRGLFAILTETGTEALSAATPGHANDVRTWFFDVINPDELEVIGRVMARADEKLSSS